jgi:hypothetical protein
MFSTLLNRNDGVLRIQSNCFFDAWQVFGKKGRLSEGVIRELIDQLKVECSRVARSGRCVYEPEEIEVEGVKVSVGFTISGITTARIL